MSAEFERKNVDFWRFQTVGGTFQAVGGTLFEQHVD